MAWIFLYDILDNWIQILNEIKEDEENKKINDIQKDIERYQEIKINLKKR